MNYRGCGVRDGVLTEMGAVGGSDGPGMEQAWEPRCRQWSPVVRQAGGVGGRGHSTPTLATGNRGRKRRSLWQWWGLWKRRGCLSLNELP